MTTWHPVSDIPKEINIAIGLHACGKSSFLKALKGTGYILSWDDIEEEYRYQPKRVIYSVMMSRLKKALLDPSPRFHIISIDSTNLTFKQRQNYYRLIEKYAPKATIRLYVWKPDVPRCMFWNTQRPRSRQVSAKTLVYEAESFQYPYESIVMDTILFETAPPEFAHFSNAPRKWEQVQQRYQEVKQQIEGAV